MAKKSEEIIEKPVASRGRPRKDASTSTTKKASKSKAKKKTTKKASSSKKSTSKKTKSSTKSKKLEVVELVNDVQIETPVLSEEITVNTTSIEPELTVTIQEPIENCENIEVEKDTDAQIEVTEVPETISEETVPVDCVEQPVVTPKAKKRTIRNISIKRPSIAELEEKNESENDDQKDEVVNEAPEQIIEEETTIQEDANIEEKFIVLPKREKRTLRLNLNSNKKQNSTSDQPYKKDESINQNSAFFNEPSIFAKFNIDITCTDTEETNQTVEDTSTSEEVNQENIDQDVVSQETVENIESMLDEKLESLIEDALVDELISNEEQSDNIAEKTTEESLIDEEIEKAILEEISETISEETIETEFENSEILNSVRSILGGKLGNLEETSDDYEDETNTTIPENCIEINIENNEEENKILENLEQDVVELKEAADTIDTVEKISDNSPIGKFFDSSIPSMSSTVNNTFSKIKKSIFSNISPIFKKFTFEEATLRNTSEDIENNYVEAENNLSDIQKALENFTPNAQVVTNITEMDVKAEPVITIPTLDTNTVLSTETTNVSFDAPELNIITPEAESSYEDLDELDEENKETDNTVENNTLEIVEEDEYNDEEFSIESYFGLDNVTLDEEVKEVVEDDEIPEEVEDTTSNPDDFANKFLEENNADALLEDEAETDVENNELVDEDSEETIVTVEKEPTAEVNELEKTLQEKELEISNLSKLLESFTQTISTLTNRITDLENKQSSEPEIQEENIVEELLGNTEDDIEDINIDDIDINDLDINDLDINDFDINDLDIEEPSLLSQENNNEDTDKSVESILSEVLLSKDLDSELKDELLSEVLSYEEESSDDDSNIDKALLEEALLAELSDEELTALDENNNTESQEPLSDFSKIIDSLTKAITELEQTPDVKQEVEKKNVVTPIAPLPAELTNYTVTEEKAINILINKDDIFSISILNETYEIVADFDGISVLSENLHISTPKNNFFVKVGNKYIEIHNKKDHFVLNTNFEDIEFANAINNIAFAKKNNKIELNIKEAFKLSSVNNKIELSMLNKAIADLSSAVQSNEDKDESSICDNKTLLISEETQKVYLPYTIEDVMKKLKSSDEYQTVQEVVDNEYTLPLSTFKMPIISRFKEAYRFMRTKENSSVYAAVDLALELMFNSNLNPAVIRAAKDLKELNIYLDCLYENEVEKFDCFKIVYKILPKIQ